MPAINHAEPDSIETLDLEVASRKPYNHAEYIRIGVIENDAKGPDGVISLVMGQHRDKGEFAFCQSHINREEIDEIIACLQKAKQRMDSFNA